MEYIIHAYLGRTKIVSKPFCSMQCNAFPIILETTTTNIPPYILNRPVYAEYTSRPPLRPPRHRQKYEPKDN